MNPCTVEVPASTAVVYDDDIMMEHRCLWDPNAEERPERLEAVLDRCSELGLLERCHRLPCRPATEAEILTCHTQGHLSTIASTSNSEDTEGLQKLSSKYDAVYFHPSTYSAALLAAGSTLSLVDAIIDGIVGNGMALIRPPGHHAMQNEFNGYCFFNNVALAARRAAQRRLRVLIIDWDVHHGQGLQRAFYDDDTVMYFSVHRYEHGTFWPELRESEFDCVGAGDGAGFNWNVPLNATGMTDADYLAVWHRLLLPAAYEFGPDIVLVAAGYDAALGCPQGEMRLSPACFAHLTRPLMALASGRLALVLEGGYWLPSLAESAALSLRALLGDPPPPLPPLPPPCRSVEETILNVVSAQRRGWGFLTLYDTYPLVSGVHAAAEDLHVPEVVYRGIPALPGQVFPTSGDYVLQSAEVKQDFEDELMRLRQETCLLVPPHRVAILRNPNDSFSEKEALSSADLEACLVIERDADQSPAEGVAQVIDAVLEGRATAGFCRSPDPNMLAAAGHALRRCQRLLVVDWRDAPLCDWSQAVDCPPRACAVCVSISCLGCDVTNLHVRQRMPSTPQPGTEAMPSWAGADRIRTPLMLKSPSPDPVWGDAELLALLWQLVLPLAGQLAPQLVLLAAPTSPSVSAQLTAHVTRQLAVLAGGRLVAVGADSCLPALLGRPPRPLPPLRAPSLGVLLNLRRLITRERQRWSALPLIRKVPEPPQEGPKPSDAEALC